MNEYNIADRGFHWSTRAYYKDVVKDKSITFGLYPDGGNEGTVGEMNMEWIDLGSHGFAPRLQCFCDALHALATFGDLIQRLALLPDNFTEEEFVECLLQCGFKDLTKYTH